MHIFILIKVYGIHFFVKTLAENLKKVYICIDKNLKKV